MPACNGCYEEVPRRTRGLCSSCNSDRSNLLSGTGFFCVFCGVARSSTSNYGGVIRVAVGKEEDKEIFPAVVCDRCVVGDLVSFNIEYNITDLTSHEYIYATACNLCGYNFLFTRYREEIEPSQSCCDECYNNTVGCAICHERHDSGDLVSSNVGVICDVCRYDEGFNYCDGCNALSNEGSWNEDEEEDELPVQGVQVALEK